MSTDRIADWLTRVVPRGQDEAERIHATIPATAQGGTFRRVSASVTAGQAAQSLRLTGGRGVRCEHETDGSRNAWLARRVPMVRLPEPGEVPSLSDVAGTLARVTPTRMPTTRPRPRAGGFRRSPGVAFDAPPMVSFASADPCCKE